MIFDFVPTVIIVALILAAYLVLSGEIVLPTNPLRRGRLRIIEYFENTKPGVFNDFKDWAFASTLFDKNQDIYHQDYTMMVGILKGYFNQRYGVDCGLNYEEIKKAIDQL
jgi:hypothetical protein